MTSAMRGQFKRSSVTRAEFLALVHGDPLKASQIVRQSLDIVPRIVSVHTRQMGFVVAGVVHIIAGQAQDAPQLLGEMAAYVPRLPPTPYQWFFMMSIIYVLARRGDDHRAAEIGGALHTQGGLAPGLGQIIAPTLAQLREALGPAAYDSAWKTGETVEDYAALLRGLLAEFASP